VSIIIDTTIIRMSNPTYQEMKEVWSAVMGTSVIKNLKEKNKQLKREVKSLKNILYSIPEFRCNCSSKQPKLQKLRKPTSNNFSSKVLSTDNVVIKQEKVDCFVIDLTVDDSILKEVQEKKENEHDKDNGKEEEEQEQEVEEEEEEEVEVEVEESTSIEDESLEVVEETE